MQSLSEIIRIFSAHDTVAAIGSHIATQGSRLHISGGHGAFPAILLAALKKQSGRNLFVVLNDKEQAAYFLNDLQALLPAERIFFFPDSYRRGYASDETDNANVMLRTEVLGKIAAGEADIIVSYARALSEKVITRSTLEQKTLSIHTGEKLDMDFITDVLIEYGFEREDFVYEPGYFALRGGIIDVFSYSEELPIRIEFKGDYIHSIRSFRPDDQLSVSTLDKVRIVPNIEEKNNRDPRLSIFEYLPEETVIAAFDVPTGILQLNDAFRKAEHFLSERAAPIHQPDTRELYIDGNDYPTLLQQHTLIELAVKPHFTEARSFVFHTEAQPLIQKNFDLLADNFIRLAEEGCNNLILADDEKQLQRLDAIFEEILPKKGLGSSFSHLYNTVNKGLSDGFVWPEGGLALWCDHKIFDRYRRFKLKGQFSKDQAITLKELGSLSPGDFVTHIDHGIGRFAGLEKTEVNGKIQESVKLIYKDNDVLYVSIHSLHRIARYTGKEGTLPAAHKLGSGKWEATKAKTKKKIKELAFDLIKLYARRKSEKGFAFSADGYLQDELEASFIYEDTPDQQKATEDVKRDMQRSWPMDRLVCGDVGFGKQK